MTYKILVVDDNKQVRDMLSDFLERVGYETMTAMDGIDGFEKFRTGNSDAMVTDGTMPRMTGYDLVKEIRIEDSQYPIILLSADIISDADKQRVLDLGANDCFSKPANIPVVIKTLEELLS